MGYKKVTIVKEYFGHKHKKKKKAKDKFKGHEHQVLHLDVPLMLEIFGFVHDHCKSDSDLHKIMDKLCDMCSEEDFLMIKHFDQVVKTEEEGVIVETRRLSR